MSKKKNLILYSIVGVIILMQFFPVAQPAVSHDNSNDLLASNEVPAEISNMIKAACYDCHSNETIYPWYAQVAPVKWLVYRDTKEGRKHLNFSNWNSMNKVEQAGALDEISSEVREGEMPMKIYPMMHADAKLSDTYREAIATWAEAFAEGLFE